ncbi:hypothetical protein [Bdellovibrio sp. HCB274]|uniref:hypothetical protein n=1 Tax=Bdellovibrio sp. HCB274 TaxID=3394361 RepID=UPI0039B65F51
MCLSLSLAACSLDASLFDASSLAIFSSEPTVTKSNSILVELQSTNSDPVTLSSIQVTNGTAHSLVATGSSYTFTIIPSSEGDVKVWVNSPSGTKSNELSFVIDSTPPTTALSSTEGSPTTAMQLPFTLTLTEETSQSVQPSDLTVTNGTVTSLVKSGFNYVGTVAVTAFGAVTLSLPAGKVADLAGNGNLLSNTLSWNVGPLTSPTVTLALAPLSEVLGNSSDSFSWTVTYTDVNAITLTTSDISFGGTAPAGCTPVISGSGLVRTVTVSGCTGTGTMNISVAANSASSSSGVQAPAAGPSTSVTLDNTGPGISLGAATSTGVTSLDTYYWDVTYTDAVSITLSASDVLLSSASAGCVASVTGTGLTTRTISVTGCTTTSGVLNLNIAAGTAVDSLGNLTAAAGPGLVTVDNKVPAITWGGWIPTTGNSSTVFTRNITYRDFSTISLSDSDVVLTMNGTVSGCTASISTVSANQRLLSVTNCSGDGTVSAALKANTAIHGAVNAPAFTSATAMTVDNTGPTLAITSPSTSIVYNSTYEASFTLTYAGATSYSLDASDITLSGNTQGCGVTVTGTGSIRYAKVIGCLETGSYTLSVVAGTAADAVGNQAPAAGPSASINVKTVSVISFTKPADMFSEGSGTSSQSLDLTISPASVYDIHLSYNLGSLTTAVSGVDVNLPAGTITIPAGSTTASIPYTYTGNGSANTSKVVQVQLSSTDSPAHELGSDYIARRLAVDNEDPDNVTYKKVSAGGSNTCGITKKDELKCWGFNDDGQMANGTTVNSPTPILIDAGTSYKEVTASSGTQHICAITTAGVLKCWGRNTAGSLGTGNLASSNVPLIIDAGETYASITAGYAFTCGVTTSGVLKCWGLASSLGNGSATDQLSPVVIDAGTSYSSVSAGGSTACAIVSGTGQLKCWGANSNGQVGNGTTTAAPNQVIIDSATAYQSVSSGTSHTCGITTAGVLKCWGVGIAVGQSASSSTPIVVNNGVTYSKVAAGRTRSCAITSTGVMKCWGSGLDGQSGSNMTPTVYDSGVLYSEVSSGLASCGITSAGLLNCWGVGTGATDRGVKGDGTGTAHASLLKVSLPSTVTTAAVSAGMDSACALTSTGAVYCWGEDQNIIESIYTDRPAPVPLDIGTAYLSISVGGGACGITSTNSLKCWGRTATWGVLGNGTAVGSQYPVVVDSGVSYKKVSVSSNHACAITTAGLLKCWGTNTSGKLGNGNSIAQLSPVVIDGTETYNEISAGSTHTCGITTSKVLKCWGQNNNGQLGDNTTTGKNTPTIIDTGVNYIAVATPRYQGSHTCAITEGNTLKCWGGNSNYQVGDNTNTTRIFPITIDGSSSYQSVSVSDGASCGVLTNGQAKCWGQNSYFLTGSTQNRVPGTVPALGVDVYSQISLGWSAVAFAIKNGNLMTWSKGAINSGVGAIWSTPSPVSP